MGFCVLGSGHGVWGVEVGRDLPQAAVMAEGSDSELEKHNVDLLLKGLNIRIPIMIPIKGRWFIN